MPTAITCSGCGTRYQTKAEPGKQLNCPKCQAVMVVPAELPDLGNDLPPDPLNVPAAPSGPGPLGSPAAPRRRATGKPTGRARSSGGLDPQLMPFIKKLIIGHALLAIPIILLGFGGFFSDAVALAAALVGTAAIVVLILTARIWFVVIAFGESTAYGLGSIFVPLFWSICLAKRIGKSQQAFALLVSALIPALLTLVILLVFSPQAKSGRQAAKSQANAGRMKELILADEAKFPPTGEPKGVTFRVSRVDSAQRFLREGETGLQQFKGYIAQSLTYDATARQVSFQFRGRDEMAAKYRLFLAFETKSLIGPQMSVQQAPQ